jgi:DNA-binding MarR family transcriptional regulator
MSTGKSGRTAKRSELLRSLAGLARKFSTQTVLLHEAVAQTVGLNATDTRCMSLIGLHPEGIVTAGWLAEVTGLTTGAITHFLDQLERRGFIERVRDTEDRRKVFVRLRPESQESLVSRYQALGKAHMKVVEHYSDSELMLIHGYLQGMSETAEQLMKETIAARSEELVIAK